MNIVDREEEQQLPPGEELRSTEESRKKRHDESKAATRERPVLGTGPKLHANPPPAYDESQMGASAAPPSFAYSNPAAPISTPGTAAAFPGSGPKRERKGESTKCGTFFWINAGAGWVVLAFSVSAAADQNWLETSSDGYGLRSNDIEEFCEGLRLLVPSFCMAYDFFSASQMLSTVFCSVAVILYTIAFFRPATAPHGSAQVLGLVGGILMTFTAFFQMLALFFADMTIEESEEVMEVLVGYFSSVLTTDDLKISHGPTYGVGIFTFILSAINAIAIFVSYRQAGDGPVVRFTKGVSEVDGPAPHSAVQHRRANLPTIRPAPAYAVTNA